jgi:hypothetical protein
LPNICTDHQRCIAHTAGKAHMSRPRASTSIRIHCTVNRDQRGKKCMGCGKYKSPRTLRLPARRRAAKRQQAQRSKQSAASNSLSPPKSPHAMATTQSINPGQKRTNRAAVLSARCPKAKRWCRGVGYKRTFCGAITMSALPRERTFAAHVRFVPIADSCAAAINAWLRTGIDVG